MNKATKLWKANLNSGYHSWRKTIDKESGEVTVRIKREKDSNWEELE